MRLRRISFTVILWSLVGIAILAGLVYMEWSRDTVEAMVVSRRERIVPNLTGSSWERHTEVRARYIVENRFYERWTRVETRQYDQLTRGSSLTLRYVRVNPDWAHPEGETVVHWFLQDVDLLQVLTILVLLGGLFLAVRQHRRQPLHRWWLRPRPLLRRMLLVGAILLWTQLVVASYSAPRLPAIGVGERSVAGEARIRSVVTITQLGGGHRENGNGLPIGLPQGFHRVELSFVPGGQVLPVIAVDEIDEGSAERLAGNSAPIHYDPDDPRNARLDAGTRSHQWKNPLIIHGAVSLLVLVVVLLPLGVRWFKGGGRIGLPIPVE